MLVLAGHQSCIDDTQSVEPAELSENQKYPMINFGKHEVISGMAVAGTRLPGQIRLSPWASHL
jgi:hypothetical protein